MPIESRNPASGEILRHFDEHDEAAVERLLDRACSASQAWREQPLAIRTNVVRGMADVLDADQEQWARLMTSEMGKTLRSARDEVAKCALTCRWYADNAESLLAPQIVHEDGREVGRVICQPLGAILAVMPWNFPFWQALRFAAPALAAGNVVLLKHASNVPASALALEEICRRAGAPEGVFQTLLVGSKRVADLVADSRVAAVTLTGSEGAGSAVGAAAGRAIKKSVLELGGSDPFIVMPSADVDAAVAAAVRSRTINNGQSCIAAKRFIVANAVYDRFVDKFTAAMNALAVGDPMLDDTDVGPLATDAIRSELHEQVRRTVEMGGTLLTGGEQVNRPGNFYRPTVLADVPEDSPAYKDELFGPVATVFRATDAADAVRIANDTHFGLGASAWTNDPEEAVYFAEAIEAGQVFINAIVASDPRFPFGGVKRSGYGRELAGYGLREFVNVKTIRTG